MESDPEIVVEFQQFSFHFRNSYDPKGDSKKEMRRSRPMRTQNISGEINKTIVLQATRILLFLNFL